MAVVSRNWVELVDLFFACGKDGAVLAPLSHRLEPPELGDLLATVDPSLLVVEESFVDEMPTSGPSKIDRSAIERRFGGSDA